MKITLRKAAKLRNRISEVLRSIDDELISTNVLVKVMDPDVAKQVKEASEDLQHNNARSRVLTDVLYSIRQKISEVNHTAGISRRLTEKENLSKRQYVLERFKNVRPDHIKPTDEQLMARLHAAVEHLKVAESYHDSMYVGIIPNEMIESVKVSLQEIEREIDNCQEEIETLNSTNHIELNSIELSVLDQENIPV